MEIKTDTCENNMFKKGIEDALKANLISADLVRAYLMGGAILSVDRRLKPRGGLRIVLDRRIKLREANF